MPRCNKCLWEVVGVIPVWNSGPRFDTHFGDHMFNGVKAGKSHRGLHSLYRYVHGSKKGTPYEHVVDKKKATGSNDRVPDDGCPHLYSALIKTGDDKEAKLSSVFPDSMCEDTVKEAVDLAWRNWKGEQQHPQQVQPPAWVPAGVDKQAWAGRVSIVLGNNTWTIWVGSPQSGVAKAIETAYPAIKRKFY